ncbi:MAG TPA: helix-turn-helix transcriptional regulator [Pseudolabrys sp.]|nr:helix-turn-helix transcriptional regulator [Pseudolabrys sp.]
MKDDQGLTQLIGDIYDAALDSSRWASVLAKIAVFTGSQAASLLSKDSVSKSVNVHYQSGIDPYFVRLYIESYSKFDPLANASEYTAEQIVNIPDLVPYDEFKAGRFFREWAQPQGWVDAANVLLEKSATNCIYLSILRNRASGIVDEEMRRRMRLIVPHVRRAVRTGKVIDLSQAKAATFADILDGLSPAIFLIDAGGQLVYGNTAGHSILNKSDLLRTVHGRLTAVDTQIDQALHDAFVAAGRNDGNGKGAALPMKGFAGERYVAHILPLGTSEKRKAGTASNAVAALFVRKAELEAEPSAEVIGKTYKLTPTELRVLRAIVNIGGVRQVAGNLGVADTTVKTHLGRLFEKTGVSRQADLVKLVAGYASMLAN